MVQEVFFGLNNVDELKSRLVAGGFRNLHVLADFDRTLTSAHRPDGSFIPSVISLLRDEQYISEEYSIKAKELFNKYHPIEIDPNVKNGDKVSAMLEWWNKHFELLLHSGLEYKHLRMVVDSGIIRLREGVKELFVLLHKHKVPVIILSAQGIGNTIPLILEREGLLLDNVFVVTNMFVFDDSGKVVSGPKLTIHSMNKGEVALHTLPVYHELVKRKNVLLLGDGLGDVDMVKGFAYNILLKVGFLNELVTDDNLRAYKEHFDMILTGDGPMTPVNKLLGEFDG